MSLRKLVVGILLGFVGLMFIIYVTPEIEAEVSSANISNSFVSAMVDMAEWLLPIGGIVGVFYGVFRLFEGQRGACAVGTAAMPVMPLMWLGLCVRAIVRNMNVAVCWIAKALRKVPD